MEPGRDTGKVNGSRREADRRAANPIGVNAILADRRLNGRTRGRKPGEWDAMSCARRGNFTSCGTKSRRGDIISIDRSANRSNGRIDHVVGS
jgi:hypothetical protein